MRRIPAQAEIGRVTFESRSLLSHFRFQKDYGTTAFIDCVLLLSLPDTLTDVAA